jgi:hypothetical protein
MPEICVLVVLQSLIALVITFCIPATNSGVVRRGLM